MGDELSNYGVNQCRALEISLGTDINNLEKNKVMQVISDKIQNARRLLFSRSVWDPLSFTVSLKLAGQCINA